MRPYENNRDRRLRLLGDGPARSRGGRLLFSAPPPGPSPTGPDSADHAGASGPAVLHGPADRSHGLPVAAKAEVILGQLIIVLAAAASVAIPLGIASQFVVLPEPILLAAEQPVVLPEQAPAPKTFPVQEFFGYVMAATNPGGSQARDLVLTRGELSRRDPICDLAFADVRTYDAAIQLLDKPVRLLGVVVERGGASLVLVQQLHKLK